MLENKTTICNRALSLIGEDPINSIDDNNDKYIFSTINSTLSNNNNQYYKILEKQVYKNVYPSYTYNCVVSAIKENTKITL